MNGLKEIEVCIKNFVLEKEQTQKKIFEIEQKRTFLAQQRNEKKKLNNTDSEVNELGRQIAELGNQSQELQRNLDSALLAIKAQLNLVIDNSIAEGIRKIRIIHEEIQTLENKIASYKERNEKYQLQKEEFYARFGRMPELSEGAKKESKLQEKEELKNRVEIKNFELKIQLIQEELEEFANAKTEFQRGNFSYMLNQCQPIHIEEIYVEGIDEIEEFFVEEMPQIEELQIDELYVEEFKAEEPQEVVEKKIIENPDIEIEKLAKAIIEEIAAEQAKLVNIEEQQEIPEDIITFEEEKEEKKEKVIIPLFGQKPTISSITVKIEDGELVYKAQMTNDEEVKIYPAKLGDENVLLRDKQNRKECEEILINYSVAEYKIFDKKVVNKIDPLVCELLIECADKYSYDAQEFIYNYAMSFADNEETDLVPPITYNLSFIEKSNLNRKEKAIINKICKNAKRNDNIEIIESFTKFKKIKYILKRIFAVNNANVLPEAKY